MTGADVGVIMDAITSGEQCEARAKALKDALERWRSKAQAENQEKKWWDHPGILGGFAMVGILVGYGFAQARQRTSR